MSKGEHIVIEMTMSVSEIINCAKSIINKEQGIIKKILQMCYRLISLNFISLLFTKKVKINSIIIIENKIKNPVVKLSNAHFYIHEKGVFIGQMFIGYENIISFGVLSKKVMFLNALIENQKMKYNFLEIILETQNPEMVNKHIKNYMYYHIKFNRINEKVIYYYNKLD